MGHHHHHLDVQHEEVPLGQPRDMIYEPPQIEVLVTAEELEREAQYGGLAAYGPPLVD